MFVLTLGGDRWSALAANRRALQPLPASRSILDQYRFPGRITPHLPRRLDAARYRARGAHNHRRHRTGWPDTASPRVTDCAGTSRHPIAMIFDAARAESVPRRTRPTPRRRTGRRAGSQESDPATIRAGRSARRKALELITNEVAHPSRIPEGFSDRHRSRRSRETRARRLRRSGIAAGGQFRGGASCGVESAWE